MRQTTEAQEPGDLEEWLAREFQFDEDDLNANRSGILSDKQKRIVRDWRVLLAVVATCLAGVGGFAIIGLEFKTATSSQPLDIAGLVSAVGSGILFIVAGALLMWLNLRFLRAGRFGRVKSVTGRVQFEEKKDGLHLCIGEIRLPVEASVRHLFSSEASYRFYYSEIDKVVRSIEKV